MDVNLLPFFNKVASCGIAVWYFSATTANCDLSLWHFVQDGNHLCRHSVKNLKQLPKNGRQLWHHSYMTATNCDAILWHISKKMAAALWRHSVTFFHDGSRPWRHMNHAAARGGVSRRQGRPPTVTPPLDMRQPTSTPPMQQRPAVGGYPPAGSSPVVGYPPASAPASPLPAGRAEAAGERRLFSRNFNGTCEYTYCTYSIPVYSKWLFCHHHVNRSMLHTIIWLNICTYQSAFKISMTEIYLKLAIRIE